MCSISVCDRFADLIGLQTPVGREFHTAYNLKIIEIFTLFNFLVIKTMGRLFNNY